MYSKKGRLASEQSPFDRGCERVEKGNVESVSVSRSMVSSHQFICHHSIMKEKAAAVGQGIRSVGDALSSYYTSRSPQRISLRAGGWRAHRYCADIHISSARRTRSQVIAKLKSRGRTQLRPLDSFPFPLLVESCSLTFTMVTRHVCTNFTDPTSAISTRRRES